ncbi:tripartite tricarboxylate transporter TctB family protein [Pararhizobium haloflavum]|uniref:tripartite tricarboxylate transporter TctB family protein n=1 Tax=Pararhizobium haloflavum TaxID=2037914 RepID=UPI000C1A0790|nr:tripartite tricarboxylate transporter TctB family protein [Pararhizobium haloflavum]
MTATRILAFLSAAAILVFLAVMVPAVGSNQMAMGSGDFYSVGPTALPNLAGGMVLVFSIIMFATSGREARDDEAATPGGIGLALAIVGLFAAYSLGMLAIGFLFASMLFLAAVFWLYRVSSWIAAAVLIVTVPLVVDQILRRLFLVPLPDGLLFN